jgi:hypothetical protein
MDWVYKLIYIEQRSMDEIITRLKAFKEKNQRFSVGNGWDRRWEVKSILQAGN